MGTLLQQFGHDIVLLHFIDQVLKKQERDGLFFIISPAMGPKIDVHFWNPERNEYTSAYNVSEENFIPEFSLRLNFDRDIATRLDKASAYRNLQWYKNLSQSLKKDLKVFVSALCKRVERETNDLPDVIGVDENGRETIWVELKFEGFSKRARNSVLTQFNAAQKRDVPFHLVLPKNPLYGRGITDSWIRANLPAAMKIYKFASKGSAVIPKGEDIEFIEVGAVQQLCQKY